MSAEINRRDFLKGAVLAVAAGVIPKDSGEIVKGNNKDALWGTYVVGQESVGNILQLDVKDLKEVNEQVVKLAAKMKVESPNIASLVVSGQKGEIILPLVWSGEELNLSHDDDRKNESVIKERYVGWGRDAEGKLKTFESGDKLDLIPLAKLVMPKGSENFGVVIGPMKAGISVEPFLQSGVAGWMLNLPTKDGVQMVNVGMDNYKKLQPFLSG